MYRRVLLALFAFNSILSTAQDTVQITEKVWFNVEAGGYVQQRLQPYSSQRVVEPDLLMPRRSYQTSIANNWNLAGDYVTDNPLLHGPFYINFRTKIDLLKGVKFYGDMIGEHRGFSYGVYGTENMVIFPRAWVDVEKRDTLFKMPFTFKANIGNKVNTQVLEGLTFYNIDAQAWDVSAQLGKVKLQHFHIGDVQRWLGLNIDDAIDDILSVEDLKVGPGLLTVSVGHFSYWNGKNGYKSGFNYRPGDNTKFYFEFGKRTDVPSLASTAWLAGITQKVNTRKWKIDSKLEGRIYGKNFNDGFRNLSVTYRDVNGGQYANTVGDYLYPLTYIDRQFSQWAVFTQFQNLDVRGANLYADVRYFIGKEMYLNVMGDINVISVEGEKPFTYPFYKLMLGWEPRPNNIISAGITNQTMNLDKHFPTFYFLNKPNFMVTFKRTLSDW